MALVTPDLARRGALRLKGRIPGAEPSDARSGGPALCNGIEIAAPDRIDDATLQHAILTIPGGRGRGGKGGNAGESQQGQQNGTHEVSSQVRGQGKIRQGQIWFQSRGDANRNC